MVIKVIVVQSRESLRHVFSHFANSSPIDQLGEGAYMKVGGSVKQNASLEQGAQVSTATQRAETTTRHHHTEKLS